MDFPIILERNQELAIRLSFIDFKIYYTGVLSRSDLIEEFGVSEITASRIIAEYKKIRGDNLRYDSSEKKFFLCIENFTPLADIKAEDALFMLANGFDKNRIIKKSGFIQFEEITVDTNPICNKKVSAITRAISQGLMVSCVYNSAAGRDLSERFIVPLVILFDGISWIFRANHPEASGNIKYKNFNFSRIVSVKDNGIKVGREYGLDYDDLWNKIVPVDIEINSSLDCNVKEWIRRDYGMADNENNILMTERAAFVWIILNQWKIRYSGNKKFLGENYLLELKNEDMLKKFGAIP
ncbi:transcriptional regulator [Yersinia rochesterensis]|uniref:Transcriptional regulator n=1 Tax=Yersinia rochesterensis TaxID=1604335 RepID=A0A8D4MX73_9GAMM|nr:transcriptional regulator [Yersinia rochesterensis]AYD42628.1 transcriptional regulator [Yersinia rochesterensis]